MPESLLCFAFLIELTDFSRAVRANRTAVMRKPLVHRTHKKYSPTTADEKVSDAMSSSGRASYCRRFPADLNMRLICAFQTLLKEAVSAAPNPRHPVREPIATPRSTAAHNTEPMASICKRACQEDGELSSKKRRPGKPSQLRNDTKAKREDIAEEEEGTDENLENGARGTRNNEAAASPLLIRAASAIPRNSESDSQSPILASFETSICRITTSSKRNFLSPNTASVASALSLLSRIPRHLQPLDCSPVRHL